MQRIDDDGNSAICDNGKTEEHDKAHHVRDTKGAFGGTPGRAYLAVRSIKASVCGGPYSPSDGKYTVPTYLVWRRRGAFDSERKVVFVMGD